jgi:hypothetical protein
MVCPDSKELAPDCDPGSIQASYKRLIISQLPSSRRHALPGTVSVRRSAVMRVVNSRHALPFILNPRTGVTR